MFDLSKSNLSPLVHARGPSLLPEHLFSLRSEVAIAAKAALMAGQLIRDCYGTVISISEKGVGDLVTEIDRQADWLIHGYLQQQLPDDKIMSEELTPNKKDLSDRVWLVDPLDATSSYIFRTNPKHPSVMLALLEDQKRSLAVVYFPLTDELFYAEKGRGAYYDGRQLFCNQKEIELAKTHVALNHYGDAQFETEEFKRIRDQLRSSKGARLVTIPTPHSGIMCRVAEGNGQVGAVVHDNNPLKPKQQPWDLAAPSLILEEAEGVVVDLQGESLNIFKAVPIVAACSRKLAIEMLNLLRR